MEKPVEVREATREDCKEIRHLIQELADFEDMPNGPKIDYDALENDGFDCANPKFKSFVAVCEGRLVGYALYFYVYTTLDKRAVHLEDLYVSPNFRKRRIGSRLFDSVAKRALDLKCPYLDFTVLSWNPAQGFYKAKGAMDMSEVEGWHAYRFYRETLVMLSTKSSGNDAEYIVREATDDDFDSIVKLAEDIYATQNVRISKYTKPNDDEISVINIDETSGDITSCDYYGYFVVSEANDSRVVGYALYCYTYSTWEGISMYLQEFHVSPDAVDSENMKLDLLYALAKRACERDCCRLDFWVLDFEVIGEFYLDNGAVDFTEKEDWHMYRLFDLTEKPY